MKPFGQTGVQLPPIGQGTWDLPESGKAREGAIDALRRGIELGLTHIDTAEMYGAGRVEEIVGDALRGLDRSRVFVTTKALPSNASYRGTIAACDRSLQRLRMDYVDLYLLHWPSSHPIEETMRAMEHLVESGKIKFAGVSNFDVDDVRAAQLNLQKTKLACNQVLYHLKERTAEARVLPYCASDGIAVVGYTPFGRGRFPRKEAQPGGVLARLAEKHGKTVRQVILNFLTADPGVFTIPKASTIEHVQENAGACGWDLDEDDAAAINSAFPVHDGPLATL